MRLYQIYRKDDDSIDPVRLNLLAHTPADAARCYAERDTHKLLSYIDGTVTLMVLREFSPNGEGPIEFKVYARQTYEFYVES